MLHGINSNDYHVPRVQLSCSLCTYKTFSQDILDDHMDSQHRGESQIQLSNGTPFDRGYVTISDDRSFQCNECGLMYATRGDLRQHVTKVHRCGIYAKMPAGGLSIRQRPFSSSLKNAQRASGNSTSPNKQQMRRRETVYRCSLCESKFQHTRAIERHLYDIHHIDPFDSEAMKNATIQDEEEVIDDQYDQLNQESMDANSSQNHQQDMHHRDEDEQMAIIQFRNQHHHADQSPLIVKIERGTSNESWLPLDCAHSSFPDGYDDFETADDFLTNKPTPRTRQLQKARRTMSKNSYDDPSCLESFTEKKDLSHQNSSYEAKDHYDDEIDYDNDHELETADTFVEMIEDDDSMVDDDRNTIIKYRSSTQKLT